MAISDMTITQQQGWMQVSTAEKCVLQVKAGVAVVFRGDALPEASDYTGFLVTAGFAVTNNSDTPLNLYVRVNANASTVTISVDKE